MLAWKKPDKKNEKLRREHAASQTTPPANEWTKFEYQLVPGHYFCTDTEISIIRGWFLSQNRCPRIVMKDLASIRTLVYTITKADKTEKRGTITIHNVPTEFHEIIEWLKHLPVKMK